MNAPRTKFESSPHLRDPSGALAVWFTEPPGAVVRVVQPVRATLDVVEWLVGPAMRSLLTRFPSGPLVFVLDLELMTGRDTAVRPLMMEASKRLGSRIVSSTVLPPRNAGRFYLASLHAAVALLRTLGVPVDLSSSLSNATDQLRLWEGR